MTPHPSIPSPPNPPRPGDQESPSREFRRFFRSLLLFIPIALILYVIQVIGLGSLAQSLPPDARASGLPLLLHKLPQNLPYGPGLRDGHMQTRIREVQQTRDVDILFLGSSHAYRGFDPRVFKQAGFKIFNLGSSQQSHLQTRVLLQHYLKSLNPRVILYEVFPSIFSVDGVESALDLITNDRNDLESIRMALRINNIKVYNALIYGFFHQAIHPFPQTRESARHGRDLYVPGGYVEREMATFEETEAHQNTKVWAQENDQLKAFAENISLIRESGIPLLLIQAPWPKCQVDRYPKRDAFDRQMEFYGPYLNFNALVELDDHLHFYDTHHLNQTGVERFNRELIRRLFPEHTIPGNFPGADLLIE